MRSAAKVFWGGIVVGAVLIISSLFLPVGASADATAAALLHRDIIINLLIALSVTLAAILFVISLRTYKNSTRLAMILIAIGMVVSAIGTLQLPIITVFQLSNSFWVQSGLIVITFIPDGVLFYLGVRQLARTIGVTSGLMHAGILIPGILLLGVMAGVIGHALPGGADVSSNFAVGLVTWTGLLELTPALLLNKVRKQIGGYYKPTVIWLLLALLLSSFALLALELPSNLLLNGGNTLINLLANVIGVVSALFMLCAGWAFAQTEEV